MKKAHAILMYTKLYQKLRVFAVTNKLNMNDAIEKLLELAEKQK